MNIHLPAQARIGEKWRLCLSTTESSLPSSSTEIVNGQDILILTGSSSGCVPISVCSEGIEIIRPNPAQGGVTKGLGGQSGKVKGKGKEKMEEREKSKGKGKEKDEGPKQTRIIREWETPAGMLRIIEQTSFDLDKVSYITRTDYRDIADEVENMGLGFSVVFVAIQTCTLRRAVQPSEYLGEYPRDKRTG